MAAEFIAAVRGKEEAQRRSGSSRLALISPWQVYLVLGALLAGALITALPAVVHRRSDFQALTKLLPCVGDATAAIPQPPQKPLRALSFPPGWQPLLTREEQRRGISYWGSGGGMQRLAGKLLAGQPVKVLSLGGSVTSGGGSSNSARMGYVPRFFDFLRHNFPHEGHVLENKAIAASTAFMYAACLEHHVPEDADLVTLEFSVNEKPNAPYPSPERRSFEQLLRRLLRLPGRPAVLVLHHWGWWNAQGDGVDRGLFYYEPESQLTAFSHYYDLPTLSLRSAAYHLMAAGLPKFKVHRVAMVQRPHVFFEPKGVRAGFIPAAGPESKDQFFYVDATHPADAGHQVLAELLAGALMRAVWEVQVEGGVLAEAERRHDPAVPDLPRPMIPFSPDVLPGLCAMQEAFKPIVKAAEGFQYLPERPEAEGFMRQKWGWRGTQPGDWAELEVDTTASDGSPPAHTYIWLSHLASYQGMGTAAVECVSGCRCKRNILDGTWERDASLFTIMRFHVTRSTACRFRVTVLPDPGDYPQEGHKVTLAAVMVTHVPLGGGADEGSLGLVQNIGLSHDRGWRDR